MLRKGLPYSCYKFGCQESSFIRKCRKPRRSYRFYRGPTAANMAPPVVTKPLLDPVGFSLLMWNLAAFAMQESCPSSDLSVSNLSV